MTLPLGVGLVKMANFGHIHGDQKYDFRQIIPRTGRGQCRLLSHRRIVMDGKTRRILPVLTCLLVLVGCDGKDPERFNRVGKKLAEKGQKFTDESRLPKVSVSMPKEKDEPKK
jgi:hypothetical protein